MRVNRESKAEAILRREIKKIGGMAYKFVSPGTSGVPDRIVILKNGDVIFVEMKSEIGKKSALQIAQSKKLQKLGQTVTTVYGVNGVNNFMQDVLKKTEIKEVYR